LQISPRYWMAVSIRAFSALRADSAHSLRVMSFSSQIRSRRASRPRTITWFESANATRSLNSARLKLRISSLRLALAESEETYLSRGGNTSRERSFTDLCEGDCASVLFILALY